MTSIEFALMVAYEKDVMTCINDTHIEGRAIIWQGRTAILMNQETIDLVGHKRMRHLKEGTYDTWFATGSSDPSFPWLFDWEQDVLFIEPDYIDELPADQ